MGSFGFAALAVLLLAFALLPDPAAAARVLQGKRPGSGEGAPAPTLVTGGSEKSATSKQLDQSSTPVQHPETDKQHQKTPPVETPPQPETTQTPPPPETTQTPKDSPPPPSGVPENKGQEGGEAQVSAQPVPSKNERSESPPPGIPKSTGGTGHEGGGSSGNKKPADESKEGAEKCEDPADTCLIKGELFACLQVSKTASIGQFFIVQNTGQKKVTVDVKATSDISIKQTLVPLSKGESKRVSIIYNGPNGGEVTLNVGTEHCVLHTRQPVYDWQQQFQQLTAYATTVKPIYGAYFGVFTLVLVGAVFACCKFAGTKRDGGVPYQQLEMGSRAPDSSGVNNTTSTGDGWEDGWDDDWDDDEAPAKPSEKGSAGSISANGLSLRSPTNSKDGWDVDWDD
ncbi:hypothetical protein ZWY2020_043854 [Hordeum vulgare]|nr:hypothetical protein ZWY2020_043854 [Hordeum vulgare]